MPQIEFLPLIGKAAQQYLDQLANLRIAVFRDYPYLYDGDLKYEEKYLARYFSSPNSFVVLAMYSGQVVGASTGIPLADEGEDFKAPFLHANIPVESVFYFGESVLLKAYRGFGIGREFFRFREKHARSLPGIKLASFCAVIRPDDHSLKPKDYRSLHELWTKMGFKLAPGLTARYTWKDVDQDHETEKLMQFWVKSLA